nr:MAG TPA: hypothetical protein [Caudoviricetes sp.]
MGRGRTTDWSGYPTTGGCSGKEFVRTRWHG